MVMVDIAASASALGGVAVLSTDAFSTATAGTFDNSLSTLN
jgi:hypothetical protein